MQRIRQLRNLQRKSTESLTTSEKKVSKCVKCDKIAVIIEDNNYYCGEHYCLIKGIPEKNGEI